MKEYVDIASQFAEEQFALRLLSETTSTNDVAKSWAEDGASDGSIVIADTQSQGRGRQGRSWLANAGESLLFSYVSRVSMPLQLIGLVSLTVGLATHRVLKDYAPDVRLKWPNDLVTRSADGPLKKLAGILVESAIHKQAKSYLVIGIGINVHTKEFDESVRDRAISIAQLTKKPINRGILAIDLAKQVRDDLRFLIAHPTLLPEKFAKADVLYGQTVHIDFPSGQSACGIANGIAPDGRLRLETVSGEQLIASGDAHLKLAI